MPIFKVFNIFLKKLKNKKLYQRIFQIAYIQQYKIFKVPRIPADKDHDNEKFVLKTE